MWGGGGDGWGGGVLHDDNNDDTCTTPLGPSIRLTVALGLKKQRILPVPCLGYMNRTTREKNKVEDTRAGFTSAGEFCQDIGTILSESFKSAGALAVTITWFSVRHF